MFPLPRLVLVLINRGRVQAGVTRLFLNHACINAMLKRVAYSGVACPMRTDSRQLAAQITPLFDFHGGFCLSVFTEFDVLMFIYGDALFAARDAFSPRGSELPASPRIVWLRPRHAVSSAIHQLFPLLSRQGFASPGDARP